MTYAKPLIRSVDDACGAAFCHFVVSPGCSVSPLPDPTTGGPLPICLDTGGGSPQVNASEITPTPILTNTVVGVDDGSVRVAPLAGTGLPFTQAPITIGAPASTQGIHLDVRLSGSSYGVDTGGFGVIVGGAPILVGLP